jgi:hypothetical protein
METSNREKALFAAVQLAVAAGGRADALLVNARDILKFLDGDLIQPAISTSVVTMTQTNPPPAEPAPPKARAKKSAVTTTGTPAPQPAPAPAAEAAPSTATSPSKQPTEDDVRLALTACQTRKGSIDVPRAILAKYSSNKVISGLKAEDRATVIAECAAA